MSSTLSTNWWSLIFAQAGSAAHVDSNAHEADSSAMDAAEREEIRASLTGDGDAYARLVKKYQGEVAARMRRFSRDQGVIEELVHDVFVEAYFSLQSFKGRAPLGHWLAKIATRVGYRHWKEKARRGSTLELKETAAVFSPVQSHDDELDSILAKLSPRDRLVVTLLYLDERSVVETSELTGWSPTMVKVQAFRARGKLRKLMKDEQRGVRQ